MARQRKMTDAVFDKICMELSHRWHGLNTICEEFNTSGSAFHAYLNADKKGKQTEKYVRARESQAEYLFDLQRETVMNRDKDHTPFTGANVVQRDRLISDTIKWQASKLNNKKYGDKLEVDQKSDVTVTFK